jgi:alkylation response protein AidB-like acyl-CoA dehydrogenase
VDVSELDENSVRAEVRAWLEANWDPNLGLVEWRNTLIESGWGMPAWPKQWYGRNLPAGLAPVVDEEFRRIGAVGVARMGIRMLAAATILEHGTDMHKEKFLRRILTGEDTWCQLFSEPGSGSDLAGATTRAEFRGNRWVINGQKVWTTSAHLADYGLLLARTDWEVPKHKGLSYFIIDMKQPGVDVQPLRQMNGHASFNQVFFTDAEVAPEFQVSEPGNGWAVATTTLMNERRNADSLRSYARGTDKPGRAYEEERAELATIMEPYKWYPQRAGRVDLVLERAKATGKNSDPIVRQEIAKQEQGRPQGPEGSLGKLVSSHVARAAAHVHTLIAGADAMLTGEDSPMDGVIAEILVSTPATSIAGGTDEIQKNIISERVLGMPKETRVDTDRPFREVPRNTIS